MENNFKNNEFPKLGVELFNSGKIVEFNKLLHLYESGIKEIKTKLEILDKEFSIKYDYNPIHHIESRLKSAKSVIGKLQRKNLPINITSVRENLYDIAGIRVICNYVDDIYLIAKLLGQQDDICVIETKDYIKNPKENGYRSLHLVVEIPIFLSSGKQPIPVEIQIRTIAMDFWASLEHHLHYKTNGEVPSSVSLELSECAKTICTLDNKMQGIHDALKKYNKKQDSN